MTYDLVVIGAGIVGLATARAALESRPGSSVVVLDKESRPAAHQTGRNSGVVHSGIYYAPRSWKAQFCIAGNRSIVEFAEQRDIPVEVTGKLIAATRPDELGRLADLERRGADHGIAVRRLDASEARSFEPHLAAIAALHVPSTGIIDYVAVAAAMADELESAGAEVRMSTEVVSISSGRPNRIRTTSGDLEARRVVNCAGLHSDRVASLAGAVPDARIVPFRGEYYELRPEAAHLVKGLIYPVPDPDFPFLGVHLTRGIDGTVHAGPNAVLALRREGYRWRDVSIRDVASTVAWPGFRSMAAQHYRQGFAEMERSLWKPHFVRELQRLVPEIGAHDLRRSPAGVRAQAVERDGSLVDDFLITDQDGILNVLNAPSPAATSCLEIGSEIARQLAETDDR